MFRLADQGLILQVDFVWFRTILYQEEARLTKQAISKNLFSKYTWKQVRATPYVEAIKFLFEVTIKGVFHGRFDLEVRHKPSGETGQHNYTTSISWGTAGNIISKANLTGSRLDLYAPKGKGKPFQIVIS